MSKGMALAIGLNEVDPVHYQGWRGELVACEYDAQDISLICRSRGFDVTTLLSRKATADAVLGAIQGAAKKLQAGDLFYVHYSGHGGQLPDLNGDEEDKRDETWCLYDREVVDDELHKAWDQFRDGVRILVTSDSCHSGSVTRDATYNRLRAMGVIAAHDTGAADTLTIPRSRAMPRAVAARTYRANRGIYDEILKMSDPEAAEKVKASVVLISGCQDNQESSDGDFNGLFTATMLEIWNEGKFKGSLRRFGRLVANQMPPYQSPNYFRVGKRDTKFERTSPFTL